MFVFLLISVRTTIQNSVLQGLSFNLVIILTASLLQAFVVTQSVGCFPCFIIIFYLFYFIFYLLLLLFMYLFIFYLNLASFLQSLLLKQNIDLAHFVYKTWDLDPVHTN
jgi:hypothetical protein